MHHRPIPPPSRLSGLRRPAASSHAQGTGRRGRLWAPLLLAGLVAAIALIGALSGGSLPGLSDAASSSEAQRADAAERSAATSGAGSTAGGPAPVASTVVPPTTPEPAPAVPPDPTASSAAAPPTSSAPEVTEPEPAASPSPEPAPVPAPAPAAAPGPEGQVLALVNAERATAGCPALRADDGLTGVARAHSADMRDRGFFSHTNPDGLDPFARARAAGVDYARAENIADGQPDAAAVMSAWMTSAGHRRNILDCDLRTLGVGVAQGAGGPWWTQLFGG